ncbi:MAG: MFS transporter [Candidatus Thorarchaeota archaeon]|nr:MFS transporter [Candidatus Thorarchaeota archaeon]
MEPEPKALSQDDTEFALRTLLKIMVVSQVKLTLTEGVFLIGFAILLGAPVYVIGILAAIPSFSQLAQVPALYLTVKYKTRKPINVYTILSSRIAILFMALIPFISTSELGVLLFTVLVGVQAMFVAIGSPSWNSWLRDLVPQDRMGVFFSKRMTIGAVVAVIVSLLGGYFVGVWNALNVGPPAYAYSVLFVTAFAVGVITVYYIHVLPEPEMAPPGPRPSFSSLLGEPYRDENFRNLMLFSATWSFSTALAAPFFAVYLLDGSLLNVGLPVATALSASTQVMSILFLRFWGRLSDRFSNKSVLLVTVPLFMLGTFLWVLSKYAKGTPALIPFLLLIHIITGISAAGVNLTSSNIGLKLAPRGEAQSYLAARGIAIAVAGLVAPLVGGVLATLLADKTLSMGFDLISGTDPTHPDWHIPIKLDLTGLDFVFVGSALLGFYALHRLALVKETGEVDEKMVIEAIVSETRRNVKTLSTVDGLRHSISVPLSSIKVALKRMGHQEKKDTCAEDDREQVD